MVGIERLEYLEGMFFEVRGCNRHTDKSDILIACVVRAFNVAGAFRYHMENDDITKVRQHDKLSSARMLFMPIVGRVLISLDVGWGELRVSQMTFWLDAPEVRESGFLQLFPEMYPLEYSRERIVELARQVASQDERLASYL